MRRRALFGSLLICLSLLALVHNPAPATLERINIHSNMLACVNRHCHLALQQIRAIRVARTQTHPQHSFQTSVVAQRTLRLFRPAGWVRALKALGRRAVPCHKVRELARQILEGIRANTARLSKGNSVPVLSLWNDGIRDARPQSRCSMLRSLAN